MSAGTYSLASGAELRVADFTIEGGILSGDGKVALIGDSTFYAKGGAVNASVDAGNGDGDDRIEVTAPSGGLSLMGSRFVDFEVLSVQGSYGLRWQGDFAFGSSGYHTLELRAGTVAAPFTVVGDLAIGSGATLKVLGLTSASDDPTLTITTSGANNTITLPAVAGGLTVVLPDDYSGVLTLTLGNVDSSGVSGDDLAAKLQTLLAGIQVKDVTETNTGVVRLSDATPETEVFDLILLVSIIKHDWENNGTNATLTFGTYTIAADISETAEHLMVSGGELAGAGSGASQGKVELTGASTFTWSGGSISAVIDASAGGGDDTLKLISTDGKELALDGSLFKGFELLTKEGAGSVSQSGDLSIATSATLSAGTYSLATAAELKVADFTIEGGSLSGAGKVVLTGVSTLTWSGGSISAVIDASDSSGVVTLKLTPASGTLALDGSLFKGFELLTKLGSGTINQSGVLTIGNSATLSAGTYSLASGAELQVADFTIEGGILGGTGKVALIGDSTFYAKGGAVNASVDAGNGDGDDRIEVTAPSAGLSLTGSRFIDFEVLSVQGSYGLTWQENFAFGSGGYHTLELVAGTGATPFTVAGDLIISDGATLKVQGLVSSSVNTTLTITTSGANNTITLPAVAGGLRVVLPDDYSGELTLTLGNVDISDVSGADLAAKLATLLAIIQIKNVSGGNGYFSLSSSNPTPSVFNLVLAISLVSDWVYDNTTTTAMLTKGTHIIDESASETAQHLTVSGGTILGYGSGATQGVVELTDASTFTWSGGSIIAVIDASDSNGADTLKLTPASGVTLTLAGGLFKGFEVLTKEGAGSVSQSGVLTIATSATLSAGTYSLASGAELKVADFTIEGGSLSGVGKVVLSGDSTFYAQGGTVDATVDASNGGAGDDRIEVTAPSAGLSLTGSRFIDFEVLSVQGSYGLTWQGDFAFGSSGYHTLELVAGTVAPPLTVAGDLTISDGATLKVQGLVSSSVNTTLTLTTSGSGKFITLPTGAGGLTVVLPDDYTGILTLTLGNVNSSGVSGADLAAKLATLLASIQVKDVSGVTTGKVTLLGDAPTETVFTLALKLTLASSDWLNDGTNASLSSGTYTIAAGSSDTAQYLTVTGGVLTGAGSGDGQGKVVLSGVSTFTWSGGSISAVIDASAGSGDDTLKLTPASGVTLTLAGGLFKGFEVLTKEGAGSVSQSGTLTIENSATLSAGTYSLATAAELRVADFTIEGGSLSGDGKVALTGTSTFTWSAGTVSAVIDASDGSGDATLKLTPASGVTLTLAGGLFKDFEILTKSGAGSVSQSGTLTIENSATLSAGTYSLATAAELKVTDFTIEGGGLSGDGKVALTGVSTFTWSAGTVSAVIDASDASGDVTLKLTPASETALALDGSLFKGFELLTKSGAGTINQSGVLSIATSATLSAGTYSLATAAELQVTDFTIEGGSLSGAGKVALTGASTFTWSGGGISAVIDASDSSGAVTLKLTPASGATLALAGGLFKGFEVLTKEGAGSVSQSGALTIASATVSAGTYRLATAAELRVSSFTIEGGSLSGTGKVALIGDSTFYAKGGTVGTTVDASDGKGDDRIEVTAPSAGLSLTGSRFIDFEVLSVQGSYGLTWQGDFAFGSSGYHTLELVAGTGATPFTVAGDLIISDGATLKVQGLVSSSVNTTLTITTSGANNTITLPAVAGGLRVVLPDDYSGELTLTLGNVDISDVSGDDLAAKLAKILASIQVRNVSGGNGHFSVSGNPTGSLFNLVLAISLVSDWVYDNTTTTAMLTKGTHIIDESASETAQHLTVSGGTVLGYGSGATQGKVVLTGATSIFTWSGGSISAVIDASAGNGADTLKLTPASGVTLTLAGGLFKGFEVLTKEGAGSVSQSGVLTIATSATLSAGTYSLASGAELKVANFTIEGGSLSGVGKVVLSGDSTFYAKGGTVGVTVDAIDGDGDDRLEVTAPSAGLSLTGSRFIDFEVLSVQGSYGLTWQGDFAFGSSGYHTLELVAGTVAPPLTVAGDLTISDGATLKVLGLTSDSGAVSLTLTTSGSGKFITLPTGAGGLTVVLPDDYTGILTLTLGNVNSSGVSGADLAAKLATLLASIQVKDASGDTTGKVTLLGDVPTGTVFTLALKLTLASSDWLNDGTNASLSSGSYTIAAGNSETAQHLTVTGGVLTGAGSGASQGKVELTGASTFTWSAGTVSGVIDASDSSGDDTLKLTPASGTLSFNGSLFKGFEVLTKSGAGTISQSGVLTIENSATLSAGTYSLASGAKLQVASFTIEGGRYIINAGAQLVVRDLTVNGSSAWFSGSGKVLLEGASTFTWKRGTISVVIDASDNTGSDTLKLNPSLDSALSASRNSRFLGFEELVKEGNKRILQTGTLSIATHATLSAGTYSLKKGAELQVPNFTIEGGSLSGAGKVVLSGDSTFYFKGGTVSAMVDASDGDGDDRIEVTAPSAAGLSLTGSPFIDFEVLSVQGSYGLTWQGDFAFGSSGYHTLELVAGTVATPFTVAGDLTISNGAALKVQGLTSATGRTSLTLTTSGSGNVITLPAVAGGLTVVFADDYSGELTLTLGNVDISGVSGADLATKLATILAIIQVKDVSASTTGYVRLVGDNPMGTVFDLVLSLSFSEVAPDNDWSSDGTTATLSTGTFTIAANDSVTVTHLMLMGGEVAGAGSDASQGKLVLTGVSTLTWSVGTVSAVIDASDGGGADTLKLTPASGVTLALDGNLFKGFELLTKSGAGTISQSGVLTIGDSATLSAGTYSLATAAELRVADFTIEGGILSGGGEVVLTGASTFTWNAGTVSAVIDASDVSGDGTLKLTPASGTTLALDGSLFKGFELLTKLGSGTINQSGVLSIATSATLSAGTYSLASSAELQVADFTIEGGSLSGDGKVALIGDSTFYVKGGTVGASVDAGNGDGDDRIEVTAPSSAGLSLMGSYLTDFEVLSVQGNHGLSWQGNFAFGSSGYHTLELVAGTTATPLTVVGDLAIGSGATLKVLGLNSSSGDTTLTLTTSGDDNTITLPAVAGGLTVVLPDDYTGILTLTLGNVDSSGVIGVDLAAKLAKILASVQVKNVSNSTGRVILLGDAPTETVFTLALKLTLASSDWKNNGTNATLTFGTYTIAADSSETAQHVTVTGGELAGAGSDANQGKVELTGVSTFTWSAGAVSAVIDAGDGSGDATLKLTPASGVTLALDGSLFKGFEILTKDGDGTISQSRVLTIGDSATLSAGTYSLASGAELQVTDFTIEGGSLSGDGKVVLTGASTFTWIVGSISAVIDASDDSGVDTLKIAHTSRELIIDGKYFSGFEVFTKAVSKKLILMGTLRIATSATWSKGIYQFLEGSVMEVSTFTLERGVLKGDGKVALIGAGTFNWQIGTVSIEIDASDVSGADTLELIPTSKTLALDGSLFKDFEILTKSGVGSVSQSGVLTIATRATLSAGSYSLASAAELKVADFTIEGGSLSGDGKVALTGVSTFTWSAGTISAVIDASDSSGVVTLKLTPASGVTLALDGSLFKGFELLTKSGAGTINQSGVLTIGDSATLSAGSYSLASGAELKVTDFTIEGGSLSGNGKVVLTGDSTFYVKGGTVGVTVDASDGGAGDDRIEVTAPSAGLSLMGSRFIDFEVLSVQGSYGLTWQGDFAFGSSGYHTLELRAGTAAAPLTVAGNLAISNGATLKVLGLISVSGNSSLTLTTSGANNTITLPAGAGGLTVVLPDDYRGVLTLTLGNVNSSGVSGDDLAAKLVTLLASIQVKDVSASTTGYVRLAGAAPMGTLFDLVLSLSFSAPTAANDWANDGTTATLSAGIYTIAADDSQAAQHLTVTGGKLAGAGSGTSQGKVELTGVSTFTWSAGEVSAVIDASDDSGDSGDDTLKLTPASGKTLALDGSLFKGFEILTKEGAGSVSQTGTLTITTSATLSAGTYSLATSAELRVADFTIEGGGLSGAGKVVLTGASTFTWSGGSISAVIDDASDDSGDDTLKLTPASGTLALDGSLFKGFEILTKEGAGTISQSGVLTIGDSATLSAGTYSLASGAELQVTDFTIEGGAELSGDGKVVLTGASTFTWIDGSISAVIDASDDSDSGSDTLNIAHTSLQLIIDGKYFSGFEVFTKAVSRKLFLMGTLRIATSATWSKGIYEFLEGSVMEVATFTLERGVLRGSGKVALIGAGTFNWEFGSVSIEIDASDGSGDDTLNLTPASGVTLTLAGGLFKSFELLTKSGDGSVSQSGVLTIATSATLSAGSYSLASGAELQVADFTIEGGSLSGDGKVALIGDSTFYVKGGTVDATVDASDGGNGDDKIEVTASSAGLSLMGSRFIDFEVLSVQGSYGLTWQGDFAFGSSGYHTLELVTGTPLTVAGNLAISSGATLKVQGLTSSSGAVNLTLTTSGSGVITLPAEAGGLTVVLPDDYSGVLTLTLGNVDSSDVSGADLAAKLATLLASIQVKNVSNSTGMVILSGNAPTETVFTLALILTFASNDWANDGGNASLSFGSYTIAANSIETVQHLTVTGGTITGDGRLEGNADDNIFTLTGGSLSVVTDLGAGNDRFEWHGGSVTSQIMGGSGVDNLLLSVAENTSATINLTASFSGFEWLEKSGAGTLLLTVNSDLRLGSVGADYHGLVVLAGTFGVTGGHKLSVGAGGTLGFMASNGESQTVALSSELFFVLR